MIRDMRTSRQCLHAQIKPRPGLKRLALWRSKRFSIPRDSDGAYRATNRIDERVVVS